MAKKVLITGAAGLIGRELCKQLSSKFTVIGVDNNFRYPDYRPDCTFIQQDLVDYLKSTNNDFDYVFHMGAINGTKYFYEIPNQLIDNNVSCDLAVFEFMRNNINSKLIYASSSEVIAGTDDFPTTETVDITIKNIHNPRWSYRIGKVLAENYLMNSNINFLIVRFFNVFGKDSGSGHFVKDIIDKIANNDHTLIGADETRSFCRVEDAVDALINIYDKASSEIINVGSQEEITILSAAKIIAQHKNKNITWNSVPGNQGSVLRRKPSLNKLLKYYPTYSPTLFKDSINDI
jgi:dTDP-glucose 4,6-dehydratase/UDP-glucose 4-epimerase